MNNLLDQLNTNESADPWDRIGEPHICSAFLTVESKIKQALDRDNFFIFPMGSVLNLKLMAQIAGVNVDRYSIPQLIGDIDVVMITDELNDESSRTNLDHLSLKLNPILNRYLRIYTSIELCETYNLNLFPIEFANPKTYIPTEGESIEDNVSVLIEGIRRAVGGLRLAKFFEKGDFSGTFYDTLQVAFQTDQFQQHYNQEFKEELAKKLQKAGEPLGLNIDYSDEVAFDGNILHKIANEFDKVNPYMLKIKHIKRALNLRLQRVPTLEEVGEVHNLLLSKGYSVQPFLQV